MDSRDYLTKYRFDTDVISLDILNEIKSDFSQNGYVCLDSIFDIELLNMVKNQVEESYRNFRKINSSFQMSVQPDKKRIMETVNLEPPFIYRDIFAPKVILSIVNCILETSNLEKPFPIYRKVVIDSYSIISSFPGAIDQAIHTDAPNLFGNEIDGFIPPYALQVVIPLLDLNPETGTTAVWPGSHRLGDKQIYDSDGNLKEPKELFLSFGDACLMDYRLHHRGTSNNSDKARSLLYIRFSRPWWRDTGDFTYLPNSNYKSIPPISITPKNFRAIPKDLAYLFRLVTIQG